MAQRNGAEGVAVRFELTVPSFEHDLAEEDEVVDEDDATHLSVFHVIVAKDHVDNALVFECQWEKDGLLINKLSVCPNLDIALDG